MLDTGHTETHWTGPALKELTDQESNDLSEKVSTAPVEVTSDTHESSRCGGGLEECKSIGSRTARLGLDLGLLHSLAV